MSKSERLVYYGVGINDADYNISKSVVVGGGKYRQVWICPFYSAWRNMLQRCYSEKLHQKYPTYKGCSVSEEWLLFSSFRKWMEEQEWEGLQLDKDVLFVGNKVYSEETCVFVTRQVNNFLTDSGKSRGESPVGVSWDKKKNKLMANVSNPFTGKQDRLGYFDCPHEAHKAWLAKKLEHAYALAAIQTNPLVAIALIECYENYVSDIDTTQNVA